MADEGKKDGGKRGDPLAGTPYTTTSGAVLGRGTMGIVYAAEHRRLKKAVCVKVLHAELAEHRDLVDRMRVEAQALAALDGHPNLLLVSDFGETPAGQPFIVTERLHGRTLLQERKQRGEIPVSEAIELVCQALAGLGAAHEHGVVHRDVKPGNLFVCDARRKGERRVVKVLDFGVVKLAPFGAAARTVAPLAYPTLEGVAIGTPKYFAAEQASGTAVDHRADLYAMGMVLYGLVASRGPFDHRRGLLELTRAAIEELPAPPSAYAKQRIAPALDRVVLQAVAKAPADRFQSAEAFAKALRAIDRTPAPPRWEQTEILPRLAPPRLGEADPDDAALTTELPPRPIPVAPTPTPYAATILLPMPTPTPAAPMQAPAPAETLDDEEERTRMTETVIMSRPRSTREIVLSASLCTIALCTLLALVLAVVRACSP